MVLLAIFVSYGVMWPVMCYFAIMPKVIESRAKDLDFMQYDGKQDKFVLKNNIKLTPADLYYLGHGTMHGYK